MPSTLLWTMILLVYIQDHSELCTERDDRVSNESIFSAHKYPKKSYKSPAMATPLSNLLKFKTRIPKKLQSVISLSYTHYDPAV